MGMKPTQVTPQNMAEAAGLVDTAQIVTLRMAAGLCMEPEAAVAVEGAIPLEATMVAMVEYGATHLSGQMLGHRAAAAQAGLALKLLPPMELLEQVAVTVAVTVVVVRGLILPAAEQE